ncbi:MAG: biopolymer transporter ExbD [Myxococcales bacterium]|nr:biopolymer transporter ExbD [Myxococcales bacterium]
MPEFTTAQRQYIRKRTKIHEPDPSEVAGELNIIPFLDVVMNIIMFLLATSLTITFFQIQSDLPEYKRGVGGRASAEQEQKLNLSVTITDQGVIVTGSGGKLAQGCQTTTGGAVMTVPKKGRDYDWAGLTECVFQVKQQFPDEVEVIVTADPLIEYQDVVFAMDALRNKGEQELFTDVLISAGVR